MKKIVLSVIAGVALMATVPAAQAAGISITIGSGSTHASGKAPGHHASNDWHYGDGYRHMRRDDRGNWHDDRDDYRGHDKYGHDNRDGRYGNKGPKGTKVVVVRKRQPFGNFRRSLARQHYSHFSNVVFVKSDRYWPDHYRAYGRDGYGKNIEIRISVYTGDVLGWRYR